MIVNDLSKELGVKNKDVIDFLKSKNYKVSSHMQNLTNEMVDMVKEEFSKKAEPGVKQKVTPTEKKPAKTVPPKSVKKFAPDDQIPCRSLVPWKLQDIGADGTTVYFWPGFGHVEYVSYRDLQAMRRRPTVKDCKILIEDPDICEQWRHDLGNAYDKYLGVEYPEEFFDISDDKFEEMLKDAPDVFKEVIKFTAMEMIRNENYPTIQKISIIDKVLNTGIKDFL